MIQFCLALAAILLAACAGPTPSSEGGSVPVATSGGSLGVGSVLSGVRVGERDLDAVAFAAEAGFLFPEEARALAHALLRSEFARLESERLGIESLAQEVDLALQASVAGLRQAAPGGDLESWSEQRYGQAWQSVEAALRRRLEENQRFQLCARTWTLQQGQVRLRGLSTLEESLAEDWVRRIRHGASSRALVESSLDPGPQGDGVLPWLPAELSIFEPAAAVTTKPEVGQVWGPVQLRGDRVWRVFEVLELREAVATSPPRAVLLKELRENPVGPLEERAWFSAMADRYNAREGLPVFEPPAHSFVRPSLR
ncbi:MAG: hypothetical protein MK209_07570 [Planctomycetes bacterium]|nr:hypothetical protein [Planctomycetota bacterium]